MLVAEFVLPTSDSQLQIFDVHDVRHLRFRCTACTLGSADVGRIGTRCLLERNCTMKLDDVYPVHPMVLNLNDFELHPCISNGDSNAARRCTSKRKLPFTHCFAKSAGINDGVANIRELICLLNEGATKIARFHPSSVSFLR